MGQATVNKTRSAMWHLRLSGRGEKMISSALTEIVMCEHMPRGGRLLCVVPEGDPDRATFRFNLNDVKQQS